MLVRGKTNVFRVVGAVSERGAVPISVLSRLRNSVHHEYSKEKYLAVSAENLDVTIYQKTEFRMQLLLDENKLCRTK